MTARRAVRAASASPAGEGESFFGNQNRHLPHGGCLFFYSKDSNEAKVFFASPFFKRGLTSVIHRVTMYYTRGGIAWMFN